MPSSYSPSLRIELIAPGEQAGTWGTTTNTNLGTLVEDAISGYVSVAVASANQAFTALNGAADQSRNAIIELVSAPSAFAVYAPPESKLYTIFNNTSHTATIYNSTALGNTTAAGAGVAIPAGKTMTVWSEGVNFAFQNTSLATANFRIEETGGKLIFKHGATTIASLSSAGVFTALSSVTATGTP
jgi:hypothetical protein